MNTSTTETVTVNIYAADPNNPACCVNASYGAEHVSVYLQVLDAEAVQAEKPAVTEQVMDALGQMLLKAQAMGLPVEVEHE